MGTDRLTKVCANLGKLSDAELRLQAPGLMRSIADELSAASSELDRYLRDKKQFRRLIVLGTLESGSRGKGRESFRRAIGCRSSLRSSR